MSSEGWLNRSIVRFFQHRCAEHALRIDGAGKYPEEARRLALSATIESFRGNGLDWSESHITEIVEAIPEGSDRLEWIGSVYPTQEVATFAVTLCHCHSGELVTLYTTAPDLEAAIEWSDFYCRGEWGRLGVADIRNPAMSAKGGMRGMDEPGAMATAAYWFRQSVVSFFDHRRAEHLLRCTTEGMGTTPREVHALALDDTLDHFRGNYLGFSDASVTEVIEAASRIATDAQAEPPYDRVVVVEISECGDGLNWLDSQGDLSAPGDDLFWVALDANADPEHNLRLLGEVRKHHLEPRFAAAVEEKIQEYRESLENTAEANG